ncbi:MAG: energy-coupling factor transporter transmembrane protein EcfT [Thaumarchaeota archaeon]|nr:energy-coupling factor transporter transmembrane protein EcfT [Candidatus Calditenuaceae archaeon]MDW8041990.1 energy-coupling factor transporter transmembrane component T [Nitrososphaerota archaeon]
MAANIADLLRYREVESPLIRLDPRVKLLIAIYLFSTTLIFDRPFWLSILVSTAVLFTVWLTLLSIGASRRLLRTIRALSFFLAFVVLLNALGFVSQGLNPLTPEFVAITSSQLMRFIAAIVSFSFFLLTVSPEAFAATLRSLKLPYDYVFAMTAAIRFAPLFLEEIQEVIDSQRLRGVDYSTRNPIKRFRNYVRAFVPVVINALKRSFEMAEALEVKCYGAVRDRTSFYVLRAKGSDVGVLVASTAAFATLVTLRLLL